MPWNVISVDITAEKIACALASDSIKTVRLHLRLDCFYCYDLSSDFFCIFLLFFSFALFSFIWHHRQFASSSSKMLKLKGICTSAWHLRVPINSVISCVNLTHRVRALEYRMKVQNFVSIQFFASIYFAFHFALFVLFHSLLPLQQHRKNQNKKTIKFNSRYWVNVWLNVMLARTPSIEIKTRFGIRARASRCQNLCASFYLCWEKFFFLTGVLAPGISIVYFPSLSEIRLSSLFLLALLLFFHIAHSTRPFWAWAATHTERGEKYMYRTRKIDVVEQNSFPRDKTLIAPNEAKFHAHNLNRIDGKQFKQHLIHFN